MPSLVSLLPGVSSHSFPTFSPSRETTSHSSSSTVSLPNLYVTFKVLQLLKTFRKRVKTRVQTSTKVPKKQVADDFCQGFERQAFEEIDRYLGRKTVHSRSKPKERLVLTTTATEQVPAKNLDWLLDQIDQAVKCETYSLSAIAASETLFVKRQSELLISKDCLSLNSLVGLLVVVKELLNSLKRTRSSQHTAKTVCEGNELLDVDLDDTYIANLEHLLLCLKDQLLRLLVLKLIELVHKHVVECQCDQSKRSEDWFFEFPDARRPLSTTWPWAIRPSLAVLWGVCWMFYDHNGSNLPPLFDQNGNMVNEQGEIVAESRAVQQYLSEFHRQQQGFYTPLSDPVPRHQHLRSPRSAPPAQPSETNANMAAPHPNHNFRYDASSHSQHHSGESRLAEEQFFGVLPVPSPTLLLTQQAGIPSTVAHVSINTYAAAPPAYDYPGQAAPPPAPVNNWVPQEDFETPLDIQGNAYAADVGPWQHLPPQQAVAVQQQAAFDYPPDLPPHVARPLTPLIRVTTDLPSALDYHQQPQDSVYSASSLSSSASFAPQDAYYPLHYTTQHLSPQNTRFVHMPAEQQEMRTPPRSPSNAIIGVQNPRKRSHSDMSGGPPAQVGSAAGSRSGSVISNADHSMEEGYSPHSRVVKREDPPMNADNKYVCNFDPGCSALSFDRKCEWSKHMDKHDRPYRCPQPSCAKLQGFTYSGGLLRHEREVHGKHGGPKAQLMCPHADCKRHSGKGFTRKENLNEHIRRVHQSKDQQSQMTPLKREATDVYSGADETETVALEGGDRDEHTPALKRRRIDPAIMDGDDIESVAALKFENERLRQEIVDREHQLTEMRLSLDRERSERQADMDRMQEQIRQLQQGQGQV